MTAEDTIERYATARYVVREASEARWARRIAVFFLQLLRFDSVSDKGLVYLLGTHRPNSDFLADQFHLFELETDPF